MTLLGHDNTEDCLGYADREDGEGACQDARWSHRIRATHGAAGDEYQHRVSLVLQVQDHGDTNMIEHRYEQLTLRANSLREELHTEIEKMLNDIIKFKVHVQKSLEDYESFVADEVQQEVYGEDDALDANEDG